MQRYTAPDQSFWKGRISGKSLYLHEKVEWIAIDKDLSDLDNSVFIVGYACDEGVRRNQGRMGAIEGPSAIRKALAKMPNHLGKDHRFFDGGDIRCEDRNMEACQLELANMVQRMLAANSIPILLGGGHDIAFGHYTGIRRFLGKGQRLGIINFDAHYDLRLPESMPNSGTPFYQIAQQAQQENMSFDYLCLGIRNDANDAQLLETAKNLGVKTLKRGDFHLGNWPTVKDRLVEFIKPLDAVYVTIDLDGFSSAYAPGVSAPSPMGFSPDIVLTCLEELLHSNKLISMDIAEMNPDYDTDGQTAKLAASLVHFVMHGLNR